MRCHYIQRGKYNLQSCVRGQHLLDLERLNKLMVGKSETNIFQQGHNSRAVLDIIASKWTLLILHALQDDTKRYSEISRLVDGITQKMLTDTLKKLERDGIVERIVHPVFPPKVEYKLTKLGIKLLKVTEMMARWAKDHFEEVELARHAYDTKLTTEI